CCLKPEAFTTATVITHTIINCRVFFQVGQSNKVAEQAVVKQARVTGCLADPEIFIGRVSISDIRIYAFLIGGKSDEGITRRITVPDQSMMCRCRLECR